MSRRLILHIGWPKAGSSSLQVFLAQNIQQFRSRGFVYPEIFDLGVSKRGIYGQGNGYSLAYGLLDDQSVTKCNFPPYGLLDLEQTLAGVDEGSDVLLSTEWFTMLSDDALAKLRDVGLRRGFQFVILAYIRPYIGFLNSEYAQGVKIGRITSRADDWHCNHTVKDIADRFRRIFGPAAIAFRPFAKQFWTDAALYSDFLTALGIHHSAGDGFTVSEEQNQSLAPEVINIQLALNARGASLSQRELQVIDQILGKWKRREMSGGSWFSSLKLLSIREKLRSEVEAMTAEYFPGNRFLLDEFDVDGTVGEADSLNDVSLTAMDERLLFEQAYARLFGSESRGATPSAQSFVDRVNQRLVDIALAGHRLLR